MTAEIIDTVNAKETNELELGIMMAGGRSKSTRGG